MSDRSTTSTPRWLVTGGAGFIGSNFLHFLLEEAPPQAPIVVLDILNYAGHRENIPHDPRVHFVQGDICDQPLVAKLLREHQITHLVNFAAESHVDNSITAAADFIRTNVEGTRALLDASRAYMQEEAQDFRFIQISTDEVFGALLEDEPPFTENSALKPSSPYSASKAAADLLVDAWHATYDLPTIVTHCSNNYGPRQHSEKLIPHMIFSALKGKPLPVYGNGKNIRDWIHVQDHCRGVFLAATKGKPGEHYCFGGACERRNITIVEQICTLLDQLQPSKERTHYQEQIAFVKDRLGHDWRYAIDFSKATRELGFTPEHDFEDGLKQTIQWYLDHLEWVEKITPKA